MIFAYAPWRCALIPALFQREREICSFAILLMTLAGCGGSLPEVAPVRGVVEFDGKPLSGFDHAAVIFTPAGGMPAKSVVSPADGSFDLSTYATGDGARIGRHSVAVSASVDDRSKHAEDKYPGIRFIIPEKFADRDLSGLTCDVKEGENVVLIRIRSDGTGEVVAE
jgi:hypothetical protein